METAGAGQRNIVEPGANRPAEFEDAVVWAAWLYYADGITQNEIAQRLGVSRATIVNYLQQARDRGIVSIRISSEAAGRTRVARALMDRYGLAGALVIPDGGGADLVSRLGDAGARLLASLIRSGDTIGVAWGQTVLAAASAIVPPDTIGGLTVVQVAGSSISDQDFSPELCTSRLADRLHARCVNLLAPAVLSSRQLKTLLLAEPILRQQMRLVHATDHILFGVGDIGPNSTVRHAGIASREEIDDYVARGAVAGIIGRFVDAAGRPLGGEHDDRLVGIGLEDLRRVPSRICLAGGPDKIIACRAMLEAGYATHFVTDMTTADALLAR